MYGFRAEHFALGTWLGSSSGRGFFPLSAAISCCSSLSSDVVQETSPSSLAYLLMLFPPSLVHGVISGGDGLTADILALMVFLFRPPQCSLSHRCWGCDIDISNGAEISMICWLCVMFTCDFLQWSPLTVRTSFYSLPPETRFLCIALIGLELAL